MAVKPFVGLWPLLQFRNIIVTQTVGLLGRGISLTQDRCLHTGQHNTQNKRDTKIRVSIGIRTHDPSVRASEDSPCLRSCGHCDH
jgi:hypothetical protein